MDHVEALKIALGKEIEAMEFYRELAQKHPAIKDLCQDLVNEEFKHKRLIEEKITAMTKY